MKSLFYISFVGFVVFSLVNCNNSSDLPIADTNAINQNSQSIVLSLEDLSIDTDDTVWERYFVQHGANTIWEVLQRRRASILRVDLKKFQHPTEVLAGIVRYLSCRQFYARRLEFKGLGRPRNNQIVYLSSEPLNVIKLHSLNLSGNSLERIPFCINNLTRLRDLDLSNNQLSVVPAGISNLVKLTDLSLARNDRMQISLEIFDLTNLNCLDLSSTQLQEIPTEITRLVNLETLILNSNNFSVMPDVIYSLTGLKYLDLAYNTLNEISPKIGELTTLRELKLGNNELLKQVPSQVGSLINLTSVDLSYNRLQYIPAEIGNLTNLTALVVTKNYLKSVPYTIGYLINLKKLKLSKNRIKKLPPCLLARVTNLEQLDLSSNRLAHLPASTLLPKLKERLALRFNGDNNPWLKYNDDMLEELDKEVVKAAAYQRFPYSLVILCMEYIESHPDIFKEEILVNKLPEELCKEVRQTQLRHAYEWNAGKNILFFKKSHIPCWLDYPLTNSKDVTNILEQLSEFSLYQFVEK